MDHALQVALTQRLLGHIDGRTTDLAAAITRNPVSHYTCPDWAAREQAHLFRARPLFMGLSCRLPEPGSYFTDDDGPAPILVTRGENGEVRAFMNVCRHRGARVAEGCGAGVRFTCPYHGWTYDSSGRLKGIPDAASFPGVDLAENGLVPLAASERAGMIWVLPDPARGVEDIDVEGLLEGLEPELANYGLRDYHLYASRRLALRLNWKLVIDTFLEPYHFGVLHRNTVAPIFHHNLCLFHPYGTHLRETLPRQTLETLRALPTTEWDLVTHSALVYVLFPNTVFIMQGDHAEAWRVYPDPANPGESVAHLEFYIPEPVASDSARGHWERNLDLTVRTVLEEDFPTSEGMQAGFSSGAQSHITYGRNEPALAYFESTVNEAVAGARTP